MKKNISILCMTILWCNWPIVASSKRHPETCSQPTNQTSLHCSATNCLSRYLCCLNQPKKPSILAEDQIFRNKALQLQERKPKSCWRYLPGMKKTNKHTQRTAQKYAAFASIVEDEINAQDQLDKITLDKTVQSVSKKKPETSLSGRIS